MVLVSVFKNLGQYIPKTVKEHIKHPDNEIVWCGVAIGYEDESHHKSI